jgi:hypothetical protein
MQSAGISAEHHGCKLTLWRHFWRNHGKNQKRDQPRSEVHNFEPKSIIDQTRPRRSASATTEARARTVGNDHSVATSWTATGPRRRRRYQAFGQRRVGRSTPRRVDPVSLKVNLPCDSTVRSFCAWKVTTLREAGSMVSWRQIMTWRRSRRIANKALRVQTSPIWTLPDLRPTRSETLPSGSR